MPEGGWHTAAAFVQDPQGIWAGILGLGDHPLPFPVPERVQRLGGHWEAGKAFLDYLLGVVLGLVPGL